MTPEQCFWLVVGSANDKFYHDWRYNQDTGLWSDIRRAYAAPMNDSNSTPIQKRIAEILRAKGSTRDKYNIVAGAVFDDMCQHGRVYYDTSQQTPLYLSTKLADTAVLPEDMQRVFPVDARGKAWIQFLGMFYGIYESSPEFKTVTAIVSIKIYATGNYVTPYRVAHFDTRTDTLYVHNNGAYMYKLTGGVVTRLDNGDEGVLFKDTSSSRPFFADLERANTLSGVIPSFGSSGVDDGVPSLYDVLYSIPHYAGDRLDVDVEAGEGKKLAATPRDAATLAMGWVHSLFFSELLSARPHLVVTGPMASGKTIFFQLMLELFFGEGRTVTSIPATKDAFENTVSNHHFVFYDNVDTPNAWFTDSIAEIATGIEYQRRVLYTTNDNITVHSKCYIGMTTRDPWFSRTDVATRLVVLEVERRSDYADPLMLIDRIRKNRSGLWSELLGGLNRMVAAIRASRLTADGGEVQASTIRVAAFDKILRLMASTWEGVDAARLVKIIAGGQSSGGALEHSVVWASLAGWLDRRLPGGGHANYGKPVTAKALYSLLQTEALDTGTHRQFDRAIGSTRALGRQLQELMPEIQKKYDVAAYVKTSGMQYTFYPSGTYQPIDPATGALRMCADPSSRGIVGVLTVVQGDKEFCTDSQGNRFQLVLQPESVSGTVVAMPPRSAAQGDMQSGSGSGTGSGV